MTSKTINSLSGAAALLGTDKFVCAQGGSNTLVAATFSQIITYLQANLILPATSLNLSGNLLVGDASGVRYAQISGNGSGTGGGSALVFLQGGVGNHLMGSASAILGGSYDNSLAIFTSQGLKIYTAGVLHGTLDTSGVLTITANGSFGGNLTAGLEIGSGAPAWFFGVNGLYSSGITNGTSYLFFGNATHGERGRVAVNDSRVMSVSLDGGLSNILTMAAGGGLQIGSPTGGDKGASTINAAGSIYVNNTALTCYGMEYLVDGKVTTEKWDALTISGKNELAHYYADMVKSFDPRDHKQYIARMIEDRALPGMPLEREWINGDMAIDGLVNRLWLSQEVLASAFVGHVKHVESRLAALEARA